MVVLPRVSTAGSLRTIAFLFAMAETPMARVMVSAAGNPSGMAATARATLARNNSTGSCPRKKPTTKVMVARDKIIQRSRLLNDAIERVSGVSIMSAVEMRVLIFPISVFSPVAVTRPVPEP